MYRLDTQCYRCTEKLENRCRSKKIEMVHTLQNILYRCEISANCNLLGMITSSQVLLTAVLLSASSLSAKTLSATSPITKSITPIAMTS